MERSVVPSLSVDLLLGRIYFGQVSSGRYNFCMSKLSVSLHVDWQNFLVLEGLYG